MASFNDKITVVIDVVTDKATSGVKNFKTAVSDAEGATGKMKAGLSSLKSSFSLSSAATGAGVTAMALYAKQILDTGVELEAMDAKAETVFGGQLDQVREWGDANAAALGLTTREAVDAGAAIADLLKPMGFTTEQATKQTTSLLDLAGALSAWTGGKKSATEVSQTFTKAMLGEREELKGLGISISEAEVQAELATRGQKDLTGAALAQAKALVTVDLITRKSTDAQKAWNDGSMDGIKAANETAASMADIEETLVTGLYPALKQVIPVVAEAAEGLADLAGVAMSLNKKNEEVAEKTGVDLKQAFVNALNPIEAVKYGWGKLFSGDDDPDKVVVPATNAMMEFGDANKEAAQDTYEASIGVDELSRALKDSAAQHTALITKYKLAKDAADRAEQALSDYHDTMRASVDASFAVFDAQNDLTQALQDASSATDDSKTAVDEVAIAQSSAAESAFRLADAQVAQADAAAKAAGKTLTAAEKNDILVGSLQATADQLAPGSPLRVQLEMYIAALKRVPPSVTTAMSIVGGTNTRAGLVGQSGGARASGGQVREGAAYTIGEQGAEVFVPNTNGVVVPHGAAIAGGRSGGVTNITINTAADPKSVVEAIKRYTRGGGVL